MTQLKFFSRFLFIIILTLGISLVVQSLVAAVWVPPTQNPPQDNLYELINAGPSTQGKLGSLGIGVTSPNRRLHVYQDTGNNAEIDIQSVSGADNHWGIYSERSDNSLRFWQGDNRMVINPGGNVGVGLINPSYILDVNGDINIPAGSSYRIGGIAQAGANLWTAGAGDNIYRSLGYVGIGTTNPTSRLYLNNTYSGTAANTAERIKSFINATADTGSEYHGLLSELYLGGNNNYTAGLPSPSSPWGVNAIWGIAYATTTGSVKQLNAGRFSAFNLNPGTVDNATGVRTYIENQGGGTINNAYGVFVQNPYRFNGTMNNVYGVYIENQTNGGVKNYLLYANGTATSTSYFGGNVGIGTDVPNTSLDIAGAFSVRGMAAPAVSPAGQGRIYFDSTANKFKVSENGGAYVDLGGGGGGWPLLSTIDGTAAAPAYSWSADTNMGLRRGGADDLRLVTNGSDRVTINSSGNVGIGATNPNSRLSILNTSLNIYGLVNIGDNTAQSGNIYSYLNIKGSFDPSGGLIGINLEPTMKSNTSYNFRGIYLKQTVPSGVTVSQDLAGLYLDTPSISGTVSGSKYGIYQNDNNSNNYFAGKVGIGVTNPEFKLSLDNDGGIIAKGTYGSGAVLTTTGLGTRLIWYPVKGAFRAGYVDADQWDNGNIGGFSFAGGSNTKALWDSSFAMGSGSVSSGLGSTAMGVQCNASQQGSFCVGNFSIASNISAMALGGSNTASGYASLATGYEATASGDYSTAIGKGLIASGLYSTAIGQYVDATANNSITIGRGYNDNNHLINNIDSSLMLGFNSTIPTLFIGPAGGVGTIGNVGIGTTNPGYPLDIRNANNIGTAILRLNQDNATLLWTGTVLARQGSEKWFIGINATDNYLRFRRNFSTDDMVISDSGSVGIGATNPGGKLEIVSSAQNALRFKKIAGVAGSVDLFPAIGDATSRTGTALCQTVSASAVCLGHWNSGGGISTCGSPQINSRALCADFGD